MSDTPPTPDPGTVPPKKETAGTAGAPVPEPLPRARIERSGRAWVFWLIPAAALGLCLWFLYRDFVATGPMITIYFEDADGLEPNNTTIRYRGANVGQVKSLALMEDNRRVAVKARLTASGKHLARAGTMFWIVRPEFKIGSISGLRTIISGEYIAVQPGSGERATTFVASANQPAAEEPGDLQLVLVTPDLSTLQALSPISYRGVQVGEVDRVHLGTNAQEVVVHARIRNEFAPLVRRNSLFWNAGRFNVSWGLFRGAQIGADSPAALLTGAIEFATPPDLQDPATNGAVFRLYEKAKDDWKTWTPAIRLRSGEPATTVATPSTSATK